MIKNYLKKALSMMLCALIVVTALPISSMAATPKAITAIADNGTAHTFEEIMGTDLDGNRYAGRVWVDKSVYTDGQTAILNTQNTEGSTFKVELEEGEAFQTIFSALGSSMTTTTTTSSSGPMDVVLVLDTSTSMDDTDTYNVTRLQRVIEASNELLSNMLSNNNTRVAIVTYNRDSEVVIPLDFYNNGVKLVVTNFDNNGENDAGVVTAYDYNNKKLGNDSGYTQGTNLQAGIDKGFNILANATNTEGRSPVAIVLTDGEANRANRTSFYSGIEDGDSASDERLYLGTLLNAAYNKTKVEVNYGTEQMVYTVGVDVSDNTTARLLMNPGDTTNKGFNSSNNSKDVKDAYQAYLNWADGDNVTFGNNNSNRWTFDHNYPKLNNKINDDMIASNIYYADKYYDVKNAELKDAFEQIYKQLKLNAFNPITDTVFEAGGTGVKNTPLIYVDNIGKYMEIKNIQAVTLFGSSYNVIKDANGNYTVARATGTNPTTSEAYNTSEDIQISVTEETDGSQKLEIRINQEILPIILEQVTSNTVGNETVATINELTYGPLRVYYTVGVDSDILLPSGEVDITKIDEDYPYFDKDKGELTLYSNEFGVLNAADEEGTVTKGDAHVGFKPSAENRYYYHQSNQGIFTEIKENGKTVTIPENNEYGIVWDENKYDLTWMDYEDYVATEDTDLVYTYVSYHRPTPSATDNANAAEEVTYLVYTYWEYLKESIAFYNETTGKYVNYDEATGRYSEDEVGRVMSADAIATYLSNNRNAEIYAVLGVGSHRTSRFHNMTFAKDANTTETAELRYVPEYTYDTAETHNGNDVVVWLGNNGKLTLPVQTGIALTKAASETIGDANDTYALTLEINSLPFGTTANPVVRDVNGNDVAFTFNNNIITVNVKVGQTVYVSGIPAGAECTVGENIPTGAAYKVESISETTVTVPTIDEVMDGTADQYVAVVVTNALNKYGNLYISKSITSDHTVPQGVLNQTFKFELDGGEALANKTFNVDDSKDEISSIAFDDEGIATINVTARQIIEILNLPENVSVTITEKLTSAQQEIFTDVTYRARNHSGEDATESETEATVTIPASANATAVVINTYVPKLTTVDLDVEINKNFADESVKEKLQGGKFDFEVQKYNTTDKKWENIATESIEYAAEEYGKKSVTVSDVLKNEVYTTTGTYAYRVIEVKGNVTNVSYDRTLYTFDVTVTDNDGQLVATVTDLNGNTIANTEGDSALDYETNFNNTYETAPISMDIEKVVNNLSGDNEVSKANFKFRSIRVDAQGNPLDSNQSENSTNTILSDAAGQARISGVYTKEQIGTHHYLVYEENTGKAGWTYSAAEYLVTVVVAEGADGKLSANMTIVPFNDAARAETAPTVSDNNKGKLYFTNTYDPTDDTVDVDALVNKSFEGRELAGGDFTFEVYENGKAVALLRGTNDKDGKIDFKAVDANLDLTKNDVLNFNKVGKYEFDIKEAIPQGAVYDAAANKYILNGVSYDPTIYDLVVEVENNMETGKLEATYYFEDSTGATVTFNNSYNVSSTNYTISGTKSLDGRAIRLGEFTFELYEGNELIDTAKNAADGSFSFKTITYDAAGTHIYTVKEALPSGTDKATGKNAANGVTYDLNEFTVTVTVTDNGDGTLTATADVANSSIKFENTYKPAPATVVFNGNKVYEGADLESDLFSFKLYETDRNLNISATNSSLVDTQVNNANGDFTFKTLSFETTGTHFYVIDEDETYNPIDEVVYDSTQHGFRVQVSDYGNGQLVVVITDLDTGASTGSAASNTASVTFTNATFDVVTEKEVAKQENAVAKIDGEFVEAGEILTYYIYYYNYTGKEATVEISDTIPAHTSYVNGSASHNGTYVGGNIDWILTVPKGGSVMVQFDVQVDEADSIVANTAIVRDGTNTYTTNTVTNHTYEDPVEKDVFSPDDVYASIDGKKVYSGDTLLYTISYTNTSYNAVDVEITDAIPEHTTYVANSADNGGVYSNGEITWAIEDVQPWTTVTVAFMVTVNENIGAKTITNKAVVEAGNTYETNIVQNYTVEDEVDKDVFSGDTTVSIDGKKVYKGDVLRYEISYTNTADEAATVTITDSIPQYTTYVANSADNGGVYAEGKLTWTLNVAAGDSVTVSFKVKVNDVQIVTISNTAIVVEGSNEYTTNTVTNRTTVDEVEKTVASIQNLGINIDGKKVYEGDTLVYRISYKNNDSEAATVTITDAIPEHTTYVANSADNGGTFASGKITWNVTVPAGETKTVSFKVTVNKNIGATEIENIATAIEGRNSYTTNKVINHTVVDEVEKKVFFADDVTVNIDGKKVYAGDELVYKISYKNTDTEATTVEIIDTIPQHTTYVANSADNSGVYAEGKITWNVTVPAGEIATVSFKVKVNENITAQSINNTAEVKEGLNTYTTNAVSNYTVEDEADKDVFLADAPTVSIDGRKVYAGETLLYKVTFKNTDTKNAATVEITDAIPEHTTYVANSADNGGVYAEGKLTWTLNVAAGDSVTVSFKVKVNENIGATDIENVATVNEGRNTYTTNKVTNYTVEDEVGKHVFSAEDETVIIDGNKVYEGDVLRYEISYTNTADEPATVTITDAIPENTTYVEDSVTNDGVYADGKITWEIEVEAGDTVSVNFMVTVNENIGATEISNTATVLEGKNSYTTNEVVNHTVVDEVEKDVFSADAPTVSIDGKEVKAGDELIYSISYTNTFTQNATITITDAIPEYTAYVEGSADNNGVYADGFITWTLDVAAGESVTVSFRVAVDEAAEGVTVSNTATVLEGRNEYNTNEVVNTTEVTPPEIPDEPETPEVPEVPENPETGDYTNIAMLIALAFVSGVVLFGSQLIGKKKKAD